MKADIPYIKRKFWDYNRQFFNGSLPEPLFRLSNVKTYLGVCRYRKRRMPDGSFEYYDFKICINTRIDLSEKELEEIIIHEMIHYYIGLNHPEEMAGHGPLFRRIMGEINSRYGRHIRIQHRLTPEQSSQALDHRLKWRVVAQVRLKDGRTGIKVLPPIARHIRSYHRGLMAGGKVESISFHFTKNQFFNRFPSSSALKVYFIEPDVLAIHLADSREVTVIGSRVIIPDRLSLFRSTNGGY